MNLFGKAKQKNTEDVSSTILRLRKTLDDLDKREAHLQKKIKALLLKASANVKDKDKRGALFALKRKKMYEAEVNKLNGARMTLESQIIALEGSNMNMQTFNAMCSGAKAMRDARGRLDVDGVDDVMDDIRDEMDVAEQIGDAIARPASDLFDDDALLEELNDLETEHQEDVLSPPSIPAAKPSVTRPEAGYGELPSAPTDKPANTPAAHVEEDEDAKALRELEASMAL